HGRSRRRDAGCADEVHAPALRLLLLHPVDRRSDGRRRARLSYAGLAVPASAARASASEIRRAPTRAPPRAKAAHRSMPARKASTDALRVTALVGVSASGCSVECGACDEKTAPIRIPISPTARRLPTRETVLLTPLAIPERACGTDESAVEVIGAT